MKVQDLRIKIQRQAEKLKSFHKKIKEDKKKYNALMFTKNREIMYLTMERDDARKQLKSACLKKDEKHEIIIDLQRSLLRVTDQREDAIAKNVINESCYTVEIVKLNKYIEILQPKKKSMLKTSAISRIIKTIDK